MGILLVSIMEGIGDLKGPHTKYNNFIEDAMLDDEQERSQGMTNDEGEDLVPLDFQLNNSEDDVDGGGFRYQRNVPERVMIGLNADIEFQVVGENNGSELDDPYYAYSEELYIVHFSSKENNYCFPLMILKQRSLIHN